MWQRAIQDKRIIAGIVGLAVILTAIPLTLQLTKEQQDLRQRAAEQTVCAADQPTDTMLIFDASGSMKEPTSSTDPTTRLKRAQDAATAFVNKMAQRTATPLNLVGFASFNASTEVTLEQEMTHFYDKVRTAITNVKLASDTCVECGIKDAIKAYDIDDRTGVKNVAVLLSDGGATRYIGAQPPYTTETHNEAERRSVLAAKELYQKYNTTIYVIGFGTDVREDFLKEIADETGGKYYFAPNATTLNSIYQEISNIIGKGSVRGKIFNDVNKNGVLDSGEAGIADWDVKILNSTTNAVITTVKTDINGDYFFDGLCDGSYKVKQTIKTGWTQTIPANGADHTITVNKGSVSNNVDFGNSLAPTNTSLTCSPATIANLEQSVTVQAVLKTSDGTPISGKVISSSLIADTEVVSITPPTVTTNASGQANFSIAATDVTKRAEGKIKLAYAGDTQYAQTTCEVGVDYTPNSTDLNFTILLHGIGNSGDNANPTASSLSNKDPLHKTRDLTVQIYNQSNTKVFEKTDATISYNAANGNFLGTVALPTNFQTGVYTVYVQSPHYLKKRLPGILTITVNQNNTMPAVHLVTGDVKIDNALNILDYNIIIGCYSDFAPAVSCTPELKENSDITDDGEVNQFDYNLFLRDLSVQNGD